MSEVGVLGAGSFGTAVSYLLSKNSPVILYARNPSVVEEMTQTRKHNGIDLPKNITPTNDLAEVAERANILFPVVSSSGFRDLMQQIAPFLHPYHIVIHGTKGLAVNLSQEELMDITHTIHRSDIKTMSEVIREETNTVRIGCLAGPNLAREILQDHPAATVVASHFEEVIDVGQRLLRSEFFQVYGNSDLLGIELAGVLKNIIAIAAGGLSGLGYGENARSLLVSRGMIEIMHIGRAFGADISTFIGLAGVGDLVATSTSPLSRNYSVGFRIAKGETLQQIMESMEETAEGINTVRIIAKLIEKEGIRAPITEALFRILFEDQTFDDATRLLMRAPLNEDVGIS